jgi:hypothetical protein
MTTKINGEGVSSYTLGAHLRLEQCHLLTLDFQIGLHHLGIKFNTLTLDFQIDLHHLNLHFCE